MESISLSAECEIEDIGGGLLREEPPLRKDRGGLQTKERRNARGEMLEFR